MYTFVSLYKLSHFHSRTKYFKMGKKKSQLNIFLTVNSQFLLYMFYMYMVNIASQRIYGITFLPCKIHIKFHNIHALFGHNSV